MKNGKPKYTHIKIETKIIILMTAKIQNSDNPWYRFMVAVFIGLWDSPGIGLWDRFLGSYSGVQLIYNM